MTQRPGSESSAGSTTFCDPVVQHRFDSDGYTSLPMLDSDEVERVRAGYHRIAPADDHGLTIDYARPDRSVMTAVWELVAPILEPRVERTFIGHRLVFASFVTKHPGPSSAMFLHEDRTFVDERRFRAATLWIPLVDVGPGIPNGGLQVVPRSHRLHSSPSGTGTPELFRPYESELRRHLCTISCPAGSAICYDTRLLHASEPNHSDVPRVALVGAIVPGEADVVHVVATGRRGRKMFAVGDRFFIDQHPREVLLDGSHGEVLVRRWEDDDDLLPEDVAAVLGTAVVPTPEPVIPDDVQPMVDRESSIAASRARRVPPGEGRRRSMLQDLPDLEIGPTALRSIESAAGGVCVVARSGRCGMLPAPFSEEVVERLDLSVSHPRRTRSVIILEPGGRAELRTDAAPGRLMVAEAPINGSGIVVERLATALPIGEEVVLAPHGSAHVWNDGPGWFAAVVETEPESVMSRRVGSVSRSIRRRATRVRVRALGGTRRI